MPRASPSKRSRRAVPAGRATASGRMRDCRDVVDLLTEYLEGGLAPEESQRLEQHLAGCDACTEFLKSLRTVRAAARTPAAEAVPEDCQRALRSFLDAKLRRKASR